MHQTDLQSSNRLAPVAKAQLERVGFKVDMQSMDWQSVVSRRAKKEPPAQGGWNMFFTTTVAVDAANPVANAFTHGGCDKAWFGWPCDETLEKLRADYSRATDEAAKKDLAFKIQDRVMEQAHYLVVGQYKAFGAYRKGVVEGWLQGPAAVFWNISKKGN